MRALALAAALASSLGCEGPRAAVAETEPAARLDGSLVAEGARYRVELAAEPSPPRIGELFRMRARVRRADGQPVRDARVAIDATMPHHGHGMVTQPTHRELGEGHYLTEGMKLHMPGRWELTVTIDEGGARERVALSIEQPPS